MISCVLCNGHEIGGLLYSKVLVEMNRHLKKKFAVSVHMYIRIAVDDVVVSVAAHPKIYAKTYLGIFPQISDNPRY